MVTCCNRNPVAVLVSFLPWLLCCPSAVPSLSPAPGCCLAPRPPLARSQQRVALGPLAELAGSVNMGSVQQGGLGAPLVIPRLLFLASHVPCGLAILPGPPALSVSSWSPALTPPAWCGAASGHLPGGISSALSKGCDSLRTGSLAGVDEGWEQGQPGGACLLHHACLLHQRP